MCFSESNFINNTSRFIQAISFELQNIHIYKQSNGGVLSRNSIQKTFYQDQKKDLKNQGLLMD